MDHSINSSSVKGFEMAVAQTRYASSKEKALQPKVLKQEVVQSSNKVHYFVLTIGVLAMGGGGFLMVYYGLDTLPLFIVGGVLAGAGLGLAIFGGYKLCRSERTLKRSTLLQKRLGFSEPEKRDRAFIAAPTLPPKLNLLSETQLNYAEATIECHIASDKLRLMEIETQKLRDQFKDALRTKILNLKNSLATLAPDDPAVRDILEKLSFILFDFSFWRRSSDDFYMPLGAEPMKEMGREIADDNLIDLLAKHPKTLAALVQEKWKLNHKCKEVLLIFIQRLYLSNSSFREPFLRVLSEEIRYEILPKIKDFELVKEIIDSLRGVKTFSAFVVEIADERREILGCHPEYMRRLLNEDKRSDAKAKAEAYISLATKIEREQLKRFVQPDEPAPPFLQEGLSDDQRKELAEALQDLDD